jgi:hypothetical protein
MLRQEALPKKKIIKKRLKNNPKKKTFFQAPKHGQRTESHLRIFDVTHFASTSRITE